MFDVYTCMMCVLCILLGYDGGNNDGDYDDNFDGNNIRQSIQSFQKRKVTLKNI